MQRDLLPGTSKRASVLALLLFAVGCSSVSELDSTAVGTPVPGVTFTTITDSLAADPGLESLVTPFRAEMSTLTAEVIGTTPRELTSGRPEGTLGNFAADALLWSARRHADRPVHIALTNNGGLRTTVGPGDITVGRMFELMPFENMVVLIELTAAEVDSLATQLARNGGDPIAGFELVIDAAGERAESVTIGGSPLHPDSSYTLATSDYLANGGGPYTILWSVTRRRELPLLLRDAFIEYVHDRGTIDPQLDGRITSSEAGQ